MSEEKQVDIGMLYYTVLRETENDPLLEIDSNFYRNLSDFIGTLRKQETSGVEIKVKDALVEMATELALLLINARLDKILASDNLDVGFLLDEEKFILDSQEEKSERTKIVLSAMLNGESEILESISKDRKTKKITVRFLQEVNEILGTDLERYGPFKAEDTATIPYENARALIVKNIATKIRTEAE